MSSSSSPLRPLPVYGAPQEGDTAAIRAAKATMDIPMRIVLTDAFPAAPVRILALREKPNFIGDYALVQDPSNPAAMLAAMQWALDEHREDSRASLVIDQLRDIFGPDLVEIFDHVDAVDHSSDLGPNTPRRHNPND